MMNQISVSITGPQGSGKSLLAETIAFELSQRGFRDVRIEDEASDRATPEQAPAVVIAAVGLTTTQLGLPPKGTGLNAWIDSEIEEHQVPGFAGDYIIQATKAAEIARGAALTVISDRNTLISNLRGAGYEVFAPGERRPYSSHGYPSADQINADAASVHAQNVAAGWWSDLATGERKQRNVGELLMLVTSELAEAEEGRAGNLPDDKLPHRSMLEVELADTKIRILDMGGGLGLNLGLAFERLVALDYGRVTCAHLSTQESLLAIVREVSAAMEGDRKKTRDAVLTDRPALEVRLAAALALIHYMDHRLGLEVDAAVAEKRAFNAQRADHKQEVRRAAGGKAY